MREIKNFISLWTILSISNKENKVQGKGKVLIWAKLQPATPWGPQPPASTQKLWSYSCNFDQIVRRFAPLIISSAFANAQRLRHAGWDHEIKMK